MPIIQLRTNLFTAIFLAFLTIAPFCASQAAGETNFQVFTDLHTALAESAKVNKPVLVDFSGSDWCGWCIKLDNEVFSKEVFLTWARENIVLCVLDFPRDRSKVSQSQALKNEAAKQKYEIKGFPTVLILDRDGKIKGKTGYQNGGPEAYIEMLKTLLNDKTF
jgi:thiol-disulfide isomerase/thioredoxin